MVSVPFLPSFDRCVRSGPAGRRAWALAGACLLAAAPQVWADARVEVGGEVDLDASFATLSGVPGAGTLAGVADRTTAALRVQVGGSVPGGFTDLRRGASAVLESAYTVHGLGAGQVVTFSWEVVGALAWSRENASVGQEFRAGIFSQSGAVYIHGVGWSHSFVDGPAFEGDFAGVLDAPVGNSGNAGPPGMFDQTVPGGLWAGNGTVHFQTHWFLADGWTGVLSMNTSTALVGDAQSALSLRLVSLRVAQPVGPAELLLDNGVALPISAVPEPGAGWLLLAGLGVLGGLGRSGVSGSGAALRRRGTPD